MNDERLVARVAERKGATHRLGIAERAEVDRRLVERDDGLGKGFWREGKRHEEHEEGEYLSHRFE